MKKIPFQYIIAVSVVFLMLISDFSLMAQTVKSWNSTITSTTTGGNWSDTLTWVGHVVPTENDNVVIEGDVVIDKDSVYCHSITIKEFKTLSQDNYLVKRFLIVENDVNNYGMVLGKEYSNGYALFFVKTGGTLETNGKWEKANIVFTGVHDNKIKMSSDDSISNSTISKVDTNSFLIIGSDARFSDCYFSNDLANEVSGFQFGKAYQIKIAEDLPYVFDLLKTSVLRSVKFDGQGRILKNALLDSDNNGPLLLKNTFLRGVNTVQSLNHVYFENVVIDDTLSVSRNTIAQLYVSGDLVNNGVVVDNDVYGKFTIHITGDLKNHGKWEQVNLIFDGTTNNEITMEDNDTIKTAYISKTDSASSLIICSNARFYGCTFTNHWELKPASNTYQIKIEPATNRTLDLTKTSGLSGVRLNGNGCNLRNAILGGDYLGPAILENIYLKGYNLLVGDSVIFSGNNVIVDDTLATGYYSIYTPSKRIILDGDFVNNGVITYKRSFTIVAKGNVVNNGFWHPGFTEMSGTTDQTFLNNDSINMTTFYLFANVPSAKTFQWYKNSVAVASDTNEKLNLGYYYEPYGEYYCNTDAGDSRKITIMKNITGIGDNHAETDKLLSQNYPNPFNTQTRIPFKLDKKSNVRLIIYNSLGQQVAEPVSGTLNAGSHKVLFNGSTLRPGIYYYLLAVDGVSTTRRMVIMK